MPGPRTRLARDIAFAMLISLKRDGPAPLPVLLARVGYLPQDIERIDATDRITAAALRMSVRELLWHSPVAMDLDGRLLYHERGTPMPRTNQPAPAVNRPERTTDD